MTHNLPFEVGQKAEAKSFSSGYRGAWFRCKITKIGTKEGQPTHYLEYYDFPDEQISSTRLYQKSPTDRSSKREKKELMVRPSFPPIYQKNEMPDLLSISEVIAIVDGIWRVGDLVDWWKDSCYWSGRITHILDKDRVLIALQSPPIGEGNSYEGLLAIYRLRYMDLPLVKEVLMKLLAMTCAHPWIGLQNKDGLYLSLRKVMLAVVLD